MIIYYLWAVLVLIMYSYSTLRKICQKTGKYRSEKTYILAFLRSLNFPKFNFILVQSKEILSKISLFWEFRNHYFAVTKFCVELFLRVQSGVEKWKFLTFNCG